MVLKAGQVVSLISCLILTGPVLWAADVPAKLLGEWTSPKGTYSARLDLSEDDGVFLTVSPVKDDKNTVPLKEAISTVKNPPWNLPALGVWGPAEDQFTLFLMKYEGQPLQNLEALQVTLNPSVSSGPSEVLQSQFMVTQHLFPALNLEGLGDRIVALHPKGSSINVASSGFKSGKWIGADRFEGEFEIVEEVQGSKNELISYVATWKAVFQLGRFGFRALENPVPKLWKLNSKTGARTPAKLPDWTVVDDLRVAVRNKDVEGVKKLLIPGADINPSTAGHSPLFIALEANQVEIATLLLQAGAKPGVSEFEPVLRSNNVGLIDLIFTGSDKLDDNTVCSIFYTLLDLNRASRNGENREELFDHVLDRLKQSGANFNAQDALNGDTLLMMAVKQQGGPKILERMIKFGSDPVAKNKAGETAADLAAKQMQLPNLRLLDQGGRYAQLLAQYNIPADSPFGGPWTMGGYLATLTLNPDASGTYLSMWNGDVVWRQAGKMAEIEIRVTDAQGEMHVIKASARLSDDKRILFLKGDGKEGIAALGADEQEYAKGRGDGAAVQP